MGGATNPNGQANATITINNFVGNLKANLPGNSAENNAGVAYSAGVSTLYGSLSVASQEVKVFAPLNVVGMVVGATIDSAKAIGGLIKGNYSAAIVSGCSAVGCRRGCWWSNRNRHYGRYSWAFHSIGRDFGGGSRRASCCSLLPNSTRIHQWRGIVNFSTRHAG